MTQRVVRLLPAGMAAELSEQHTFPFKLAVVEFRAPIGTRYYSTGPQVVMDGHTYLPNLADIGEMSWGPDGDQTGQIELYNGNDDDLTASQLVLNAGVAEVPVTIYDAHLKTTGEFVAVKTAVGILTDSTLTTSSAIVTMVTNNMGAERIPNLAVTYDNGFHWLPPTGSMLTWGNETYVFQEDA